MGHRQRTYSPLYYTKKVPTHTRTQIANTHMHRCAHAHKHPKSSQRWLSLSKINHVWLSNATVITRYLNYLCKLSEKIYWQFREGGGGGWRIHWTPPSPSLKSPRDRTTRKGKGMLGPVSKLSVPNGFSGVMCCHKLPRRRGHLTGTVCIARLQGSASSGRRDGGSVFPDQEESGDGH